MKKGTKKIKAETVGEKDAKNQTYNSKAKSPHQTQPTNIINNLF